MEIVEKLLDAIIYAIPAAAVILMAYFILKQYLDHIKREHDKEWKQRQQKQYLPTSMQAYERLVLLLERIHPESLVFRVHKPGMSAALLQADMLKTIRDEFDHNLTQQLYISSPAWEAVKAAKQETVNIIKTAAAQGEREEDGMKLAQRILELSSRLDRLPSVVAVDILKSEFRKKLKG